MHFDITTGKSRPEIKNISFITFFFRIGLCIFVLAKLVTVDKHNVFLSKEVVCFAHNYIEMLYLTTEELLEGFRSLKRLVVDDLELRETNLLMREELRLSEERVHLLLQQIKSDSYDFAALQAQQDVLKANTSRTDWFSTCVSLLAVGTQTYRLFFSNSAPNSNSEGFSAEDRFLLKTTLATLVTFVSGAAPAPVFRAVRSLQKMLDGDPAEGPPGAR
jgi:hypothetical protein